MGQLTFKKKPVKTLGSELQVGDRAPEFDLVDQNLSEVHLKDIHTPFVIMNIVPSLDTPVCAASARQFNREARKNRDSCSFLTISRDLPFAQTRFSQREELYDVKLLSDMRFGSFAQDYGVLLADGPLKGLCGRAVFLLGKPSETGRKIEYVEMVKDLAWEPDYIGILQALARLTES